MENNGEDFELKTSIKPIEQSKKEEQYQMYRQMFLNLGNWKIWGLHLLEFPSQCSLENSGN